MQMIFRYFFNRLYLFIRIFALTCLVGCGSVQTINGVSIKRKKETKPNYAMYVGTFFIGYYLADTNIKKK